MSLEIRPVAPERWSDTVELFERRGVRGGHQNSLAYGCWCMYWRDRSLQHGEPKKRAMAMLVRDGNEPGLLAYEDGVPIGRIAIAPREERTAIIRPPQGRPRESDGGDSVWSIVCFTVDKQARRGGVATELLAGAVEYAFAHGASSVEAYRTARIRATTWAMSISIAAPASSMSAPRTSARSCGSPAKSVFDTREGSVGPGRWVSCGADGLVACNGFVTTCWTLTPGLDPVGRGRLSRR